jgi:hypothetical protein
VLNISLKNTGNSAPFCNFLVYSIPKLAYCCISLLTSAPKEPQFTGHRHMAYFFQPYFCTGWFSSMLVSYWYGFGYNDIHVCCLIYCFFLTCYCFNHSLVLWLIANHISWHFYALHEMNHFGCFHLLVWFSLFLFFPLSSLLYFSDFGDSPPILGHHYEFSKIELPFIAISIFYDHESV